MNSHTLAQNFENLFFFLLNPLRNFFQSLFRIVWWKKMRIPSWTTHFLVDVSYFRIYRRQFIGRFKKTRNLLNQFECQMFWKTFLNFHWRIFRKYEKICKEGFFLPIFFGKVWKFVWRKTRKPNTNEKKKRKKNRLRMLFEIERSNLTIWQSTVNWNCIKSLSLIRPSHNYNEKSMRLRVNRYWNVSQTCSIHWKWRGNGLKELCMIAVSHLLYERTNAKGQKWIAVETHQKFSWNLDLL